MNFLKRALYSLRHSWLRNLLSTFMFTVLFAACVGALVLYHTSRGQLTTMQETVKYSVTLRPVFVWNRADNSSTSIPLDREDLDSFADSPYLSGYNYATFHFGDIHDAKLLYPKDRKKNFRRLNDFTTWVYAPVSSRENRAFTTGGYRLVKGRHLEEDDLQVCLVSQEFADYNGFDVGSHFTFSWREKKDERLDLEIAGIFKGPDGSGYLKGIGSTPEEILMVPMRFPLETLFTHYPRVHCVQGFFKSQEDMEAFVKDLHGKFNITRVEESPLGAPSVQPIPAEFGELWNIAEVAEKLEENPMFVLEYNKELYDMTAGPMEKLTALAGGMTIAFLAAAALVLVLSNVLFLKRKSHEFGMLCAMGESKAKIVLQAAAEMLAPVLCAMVLGLLLGISVGAPLAENLGGSVYEQNAADAQGKNDLIAYAHRAQDNDSYSMYAGTAAIELIHGYSYHVVSPPKPQAVVDRAALAGYFGVVAALVLAALLIQAGSVLRLKPAKILTGKG